jgi:hypothetical protein
MRRASPAHCLLGLLLLSALVTAGCGGTTSPSPSASPTQWTPVLALSGTLRNVTTHSPSFRTQGGKVRVLVEVTDKNTGKASFGWGLVPLRPKGIRDQTSNLVEVDERSDPPGPKGTWKIELRTPTDVLPGVYRLDYTGTGTFTLRVFAEQ